MASENEHDDVPIQDQAAELAEGPPRGRYIENPIYDFLNGIGSNAGRGYERKFAPSSDYVEIVISDSETDDEEETEGSKSQTSTESRKKKQELYRTPNLAFGAFFEEEESTYSVPQLHEYYGAMYRFTKLGCYNILMLVLGLPLIVIWGIIIEYVIILQKLDVPNHFENTHVGYECYPPLSETTSECIGGFARVIGKACESAVCKRT